MVAMQPVCGFYSMSGIQDIANLVVPFGENVEIATIKIARITDKPGMNKEQMRDMIIDKYYPLAKKLQEYNRTAPEYWQSVKRVHRQEFYSDPDKYDDLFALGVRLARNEVHKIDGNSIDVMFNFHKVYKDKAHMIFFKFHDKTCLKNFTKWYYQDNHGSLPNRIREEKTEIAILQTGSNIMELFPRVDWSRPWTNEEILKEVGYEDKDS